MAVTCTLGSLDLNDGTNRWVIGEVKVPPSPLEYDEIHHGRGINRQANLHTTALREIVIPLHVEGSSANDLRDQLGLIRAEVLKDTNTLTLAHTSESPTLAYTVLRSSQPDAPWDNNADIGLMVDFDLILIAEPFAYGSEVTLFGTNSVSPVEPTGASWPSGWSRSDGGGTYTHALDNEFHIEDDAGPQNSYIEQTTAMTVAASTRYGCGASFEVTARDGGTCTLQVDWYSVAPAYISSTTIKALAAVTADTWYQQDVTSPATAVGAKVKCVWSGSTGVCEATLHDVEFGKHLVRAPNHLDLTSMVGDYPAPIEVTVEGTVEDVHALYLGIIPDTSHTHYAEAEALSYSGGTTSTVSDADAHDASCSDGASDATDNAKRNTSSTAGVATYADTSGFVVGTYLPLVRGQTSANSADFGYGYGGTEYDSVNVTDTNFTVEEMGDPVALPIVRTQSGTAANLQVRFDQNTAGNADADYYGFLPLSWGYAIWHHATSSSDATTVIFDTDGRIYADGVEDAANARGGYICADSSDRLCIYADDADGSDDALPLRVTITYVPRYAA